MRTNDPQTPLLALLRMLTPDQRETLAADAGTRVDYLYKLASCSRKQCKADLAVRIEEATKKMRSASRGKTPVVTVAQLGSMCACQT